MNFSDIAHTLFMSLSLLAYTKISWGFLTDFKQALVYNNMAI